MNIARGRHFVLSAFAAVLLVGPLAGTAEAAGQKPDAPHDLGMEGWGPNGADALPCATGKDRPSVGTRTPRLRARLSDVDGDSLSADFTVRKAGAEVERLTATHVPSGSYAQVQVNTALAEGGVYRWSVQASDGQSRSKWVGRCEFQVDTVAPNAPAVTSTDYPAAGFHGGVGQPGTFTFSPNGSADVVRYTWALDGQRGEAVGNTVNVSITPSQSGPNTLSVWAYDKARNSTGQTYSFRVAEPSGPVAVWNLDETGGTTAADSSNHGHALTLNGASFGAGYAKNGLLNTSSSFSATDEKLLDTSRAFSVSAWAKLDDLNGTYTVASQDGAVASGFALQGNGNRWSFGAASSVTAPKVGEWTHLVGTYESSTHKMSLYVNGKLEGTADATLQNAAGPFVVGAAQKDGARAEQLPGAIDDVQVWDRALTASEAVEQANRLQVLRAHYSTDELEGTMTKDEVSGQNGTLSGGVGWAHTPIDPDDPNQILRSRDKWLRFDSTGTGLLTGPRPANLRTDQSFTVAAWVRLKELGDTAANAVSLGADSPFTLGYDPESRHWGFRLNETPAGGGEQVLSYMTAEVDKWVHLAATYNAATGTFALYIDGVHQKNTTATGLRTFNGTGDLLVGQGWRGDVDGARIYSGAFSEVDVAILRSATMHS